MKRRNLKEDIRGSFSMSAGWLFADLLLVLAMLFLAANTMGIHPPPPVVHATPTPTPSPTPKILAQLEQQYQEFTIHVNTTALLNGDKNAASSVMQQISSNVPAGRSVGLIMVYGTDPACGVRAKEVSAKVYTLVKQLGQSDAAFNKVAEYHTLCNPQSDVNAITIDIFLFAQSPA